MSLVAWDRPIPKPDELGTVHFVGVGGAGMSGIARLLAAQGISVSGCDAKDSTALASLAAVGIAVTVGHSPAHVEDADSVVVSSAIRPSNPELVAAFARERLVLPRAVALASAMVAQRGIAVAGTHGKTTTTSMLTVALQACGRDPSYAIGGDLNEPGSNAHLGTGEFFVAEADESDRSFLVLAPESAIVTNVEADHLDNYGTAEAVSAAFESFAAGLPRSGVLVVGGDDDGSRRLAEHSGASTVVKVGEGADNDVRIEDLRLTSDGVAFGVVDAGRRLGAVNLAVPGRYNAMNAAAALAMGLQLGMPFGDMVRGLAGFRGARRRFELKGVAGGIRVFDDYAHHPTEVTALLAAAKSVAGSGRVIAVFQPHLYSRTAAFADQFGAALSQADHVVVMEIYAAREDPVPGITGRLVADAVGRVDVDYEPSWSAVPAVVAQIARPGDIVLTIGAGDVTMLGPVILDAIVGAN